MRVLPRRRLVPTLCPPCRSPYPPPRPRSWTLRLFGSLLLLAYSRLPLRQLDPPSPIGSRSGEGRLERRRRGGATADAETLPKVRTKAENPLKHTEASAKVVVQTTVTISITVSLTFAMIAFIPSLLPEPRLSELESIGLTAAVKQDLLNGGELLDRLAQDPRFKGPPGEIGPPGADGERGPAGPQGVVGLDTLPVGSIVAWPGPLPGGEEWNRRWHLCDGTLMDRAEFPELLEALGGEPNSSGSGGTPYGWQGGKFRLPNFQGTFLRGAGGASGPLGTVQDYATALPRVPFQTDSQQGGINGERGGDNPLAWGEGPRRLSHSHAVVAGGDNETRPINFAVHWVIRVK